MLSRIFSGTTVGLEGVLIEVETDVASRGFPSFTIVGLPDKSIDEAKDRVRSAINNSNLPMPDAKITINLATADIPKIGSSFDPPIAIGILAASEIIKENNLRDLFLLANSLLKEKFVKSQEFAHCPDGERKKY
ncbi:MAG: hypothetical protein NZL96_03680 [Patescibacteria group bacterium]|nr:hypothetical protein [Patescibacteria group bacterium]